MPDNGFDDEATFEVDDDLLDEVRAEAAQLSSQDVGQGESSGAAADELPVIDGYREMREIGRGGFSRVYEALQVEFDRLVAIKVLNEPIIDSGHIAEFERECRLMGNLSRHPNIVTVHTSAFSHDRRPCIVMELFSHGSYQNILNHTGPLPLEELLSLSVLMAGALATAHQRGVIHGDVKPQNIFRSEFNTPALGDFGIAALADTAGDSDKLRASAHYAAPELIEHGPSAASPAADQYSLAATIYTLATGQRPHASDGSQSTRELLQRVLVEPAPRLEAGFPESFANALHKAMAREPQQRHRDLVAFAASMARTQQELGFQPTDIPVGTQQARYIASTPEQAGSQEPSTGPTPTEGHTESTISLADKGESPQGILASSTDAGEGPPGGRQGPAADQGGAQPPDGSGPGRSGSGSFWQRFPRWAKAVAVVVVVAVIAIVVALVLSSGDSEDPPPPTPDGELDEEEPAPESNPEETAPDEEEPAPEPEPTTPQNSAAEGEPSILGEAWVGETLVADTSAISDGNGLEGVSFHYQWVRVAPNDNEAIIEGQTGETYVVANADVGHSIKVRVSFTDQDGNEEGPLTSASTKTGEQIVFHSDRNSILDIFIVNANGTNQRKLTDNQGNNFDPSLSPDGTTIVFTSDRNGNHEIRVMNADGSSDERLTNNRATDADPAWSPNGTEIVFTTNRYGNYEIAVIKADGSSGENAKRLTSTSHQDRSPAWSGSKIAFIHNNGGDFEIAVMNDDGSDVDTLTSNPGDDEAPAWSSDGSKIAYTRGNPDPSRVNDFDIAVMNADGSNANARPILNTSTTEKLPVWSPDDTKIAFHSIRSNGDIEIWVMDANGSNTVKLIDSAGKDWVGSWR
ncbi:MAG: protein kinase [Acidimicrobiia bacterium]|nr:protein kinase [Acidimicrobiia bacterium]